MNNYCSRNIPSCKIQFPTQYTLMYVLCFLLCTLYTIIGGGKYNIEATNSVTAYTNMVDDSTNRTEEPKSNVLAISLFENTQSPTATKDEVYYDQVELKSTAAVQSEEIELSSNVTYGRVQR